MDLKAYYKKLRELEQQLPSPFVVVVSVDTPDGGKAGVLTEVPRLTAARQIVEGRARLSSAEESKAFHAGNHAAKIAADQAAAVSQMKFIVVPAKTNEKGPKD